MIRSLRAALPPGAPLTKPSKWHITLVFLGEAPPGEVSAVLSELRPGASFSLRLTGGGRFGTAAWAGVAGDLEALTALQGGIKSLLSASGYLSDARPYQPHLTVSYRGDRATSTALAAHESTPWTVTEFALVESRDGNYDRLQSWPLADH